MRRAALPLAALIMAGLALHSSACTERRPPPIQVSTVIRDSAGVAIVDNPAGVELETWQLDPEPSLVIGGDESDPQTQLFRAASATRLPGGGVAIGNSGTGEILVFGPDGSRRAVLGGQGAGPGEFAGFGMRVLPSSDSTILAEDLGTQRKLVRFTPHGELQQEEVLPPAVRPWRGAWSDLVTSPAGVGFGLGAPLPDRGRYGAAPLTRDPVHVVRFTYSGEGPDTVATYAGTEVFYADVGPRRALGGQSVSGPRPLAPLFRTETQLAGGGQSWRVVVGDEAAAVFDVYDEAGRLRRRVRWGAEPRSPSARDVALAQAAYVGARQKTDPAGARRSLDVMPADRAPVFDRLAVARDNRVWVRRYVLPTDSSAGWWVFDPEGRLLATVEMPKGLELLETGADYVIGRQEDELGVERIALWSVRRERSSSSR